MITIFLYHQIADVPAHNDPLGLAVTPRAFERQMDYLSRNGYRCLSLGEAVNILRAGQPQPKKTFVLTFDDGFRDLYITVWPILDKHGFTATVFFVPGCAGRSSDWEGQSGDLSGPLLSWPEARELSQAGFTFASHTITHPRLVNLTADQARREIRDSKPMLEDELGVEVEFFSYPYSAHDASIREIVTESGYTAACGGDRGDWGLFNLWRAQCGSHDTDRSFWFKASGLAYHWYRWRQQPLLRRTFRYPKRLLKRLSSANTSQ